MGSRMQRFLLLAIVVLLSLPSVSYAAHFDPVPTQRSDLISAQTGTPDIVIFGTNGVPIVPKSVDPSASPSVANGTDFGTVETRQEVVHTFEIKNQGTGVLTFNNYSHISSIAAFRPLNDFPTSLNPGESFFLQIAFTPETPNENRAAISIRSNDPDTPVYEFDVTGNGQVPVFWLREIRSWTITEDIGCVVGVSGYCQFYATALGSTRVHTFTIENRGNYPLILDEQEPIKISWEKNPNQFTIVQQAEPVIPPQSSTTFSIRFNPTIAGEQAITVLIETNGAFYQNRQVFLVKGTGSGPFIKVEDAGTPEQPADFGTAYLGRTTPTRTFKLMNSNTDFYDISDISISGKDASEFRITSPITHRVYVAQPKDLDIVFEPTSLGPKEATVTITSTAVNEPVYSFPIKGFASSIVLNVTGNGIDIPNGSSTPNINNQTDFGNVQVGSTATHQFYIVNNGTSDLKNLTIHISGKGFSSNQYIVPNSLPVGFSAPFNVKFTAPSTGVHTATVTIKAQLPVVTEHQFIVQASSYLSPTQPNPASTNIQITGNGHSIQHNEGLIWPTNNTDFGAITVNSQKDHSFVIQKVGTGTLSMHPSQPITITGPQANSFSVINTPMGEITTATLTIRFNPTNPGLHEAFVTIRSSDLVYPEFRFKIQGYAASAAGSEEAKEQLFTVLGGGVMIKNGQTKASSENKTDFGSVPVNQSLSHTFIITNYGNKPLNLSASKLRISGTHASDFSISQLPNSTIAPSSASGFQIRFTPKASGLRSAIVTIESEDPTIPSFSFVIQGMGTSEKQEQPNNQYFIALPFVRK